MDKDEALNALQTAWDSFYQTEIDRIDDTVAFLKEVREGISGSADLRLATIASADVFLIQDVNNFLME